MENIAIFDIGSARTKALFLINENGNVIQYNEKLDSFISSKVNSNNILDESYLIEEFIPQLTLLKDKAIDKGCSKLLLIGTHIFRTISNSAAVNSLIDEKLGKLNSIPGWVEGALFYKSQFGKFPDHKICVLDIGGGSVQISFGIKEDLVYSIPTGTFSLEKQFQENKDRANENELFKMSEFISTEIANTSKRDADVIVMGSNCMRDFIESCRSHIGDTSDVETFYSLNLLRDIYSLLKCRPYETVKDFYPQNSMFMYGADKALLNVILIAEFLRIDKIHPTNDSVSSALATILSKSSEELSNFSISITNLK
ncbi:MAG: hypothetical protein M0D57_02980 [Sphingobacteriales bacterium JAD_PAG50586_3]|nr:MAG: hypothetical protein M0D57_02980 [Sphingobacteriales bacterium JAD_PAG50586_3]